MTRFLFILGIVAALALALYAGWQVHRWRQSVEEARLRKVHTLTGNVKTYPDFHSEILEGERRVWVYLPPTYDEEPERRFPVLYMHDGQNVFDGATAFLAGREWEADETAERLIHEGRIEPLIIVAVDHGGEGRVDEYTPVVDERHGGGGGAEAYGRMLVEELKPWVDGTFRTRAGREDTGAAGSSLGGLVSLWLGLSYPGTFGRIAALSTAAFWGDGHILGLIERLPTKPATRIWIDVGTAERDVIRRSSRLLRDALVAKGWEEGEDLVYVEAEDEPHNETAWARRLPAVLEFLFPAQPDPPETPRETDG